MTDFAELERLAREAMQDFADYDMPWPICPEDVMDMNPSRAVSAYIAACSPEVVLRLVAIAKAAEKAMNLLINMQPHIPQACYPGHAGFIDNYVDPALATLRAALSPEKERE